MAGPVLYRGMDRAALDAAYANHLAVPGRLAYYERWNRRSAEIRAALSGRLDLAYGPAPRAKLDFFAAQRRGAPTVAYFHGGYWQLNAKEGFAFLADALLPFGINVAVVGYTLAPNATLPAIVAEARAAVAFLSANLAELGGDPDRLYVSGWSAGGHLAASVADDRRVQGVFTVSGVFDLEPIRLTYLNDALQLDAAVARDCSPIHRLPRPGIPVVVTVGGDELPELVRQSRDYAATLAAAGIPGGFRELSGQNHFSIMDELAHPASPMTRLVLDLLDR